MEFKNLPLIITSLLCILLLVILIFTMAENFHYRKLLVDRAEDIINARLNEINRRFNETAQEGETAFDRIDSILFDEATSIEEARILVDQLDKRLKKADELIDLLSTGGSQQ